MAEKVKYLSCHKTTQLRYIGFQFSMFMSAMVLLYPEDNTSL